MATRYLGYHSYDHEIGNRDRYYYAYLRWLGSRSANPNPKPHQVLRVPAMGARHHAPRRRAAGAHPHPNPNPITLSPQPEPEP